MSSGKYGMHMSKPNAVVSTPAPRPVAAHAEAAAYLLQDIFNKLRSGTPPEDLGKTVQRIGLMMSRET